MQLVSGGLWWASRIGSSLHLSSGVLTGPQQDSELHHVDWTSPCNSLLQKSCFIPGLATKDVLAHEKALGDSDEEAQSLLRTLKTCAPNFSGWLLWKHNGPIPNSLAIRNHRDTLLQSHDTPAPLSAGHREEGSPHPPAPSSTLFWSCRTFSSGLGEHLALCPPACRTALPAVKKRGAGVSQGGRVGLEQHRPACRGQPGPGHAAKTAL